MGFVARFHRPFRHRSSLRRGVQVDIAPARPPWFARCLIFLDRCALRLGRSPRLPAEHALGRQGEELAYWFLRERGYTIVSRNFRSPGIHGELDLIAWQDQQLIFIEVKTRQVAEESSAEAAVTLDKQLHLIRMARAYMRRRRYRGPFRFDVVAVYAGPTPELVLYRDAFRVRERPHRN